MTNREFFTNISNGILTEAEIAHATEAIASLDARNEARRNKPTKAQLEAAERRAKVFEFFKAHSSEVFSREQVAEALGITVGQVTAAVTALNKVEEGEAKPITVSEVKVDKAKRKVYSFA